MEEKWPFKWWSFKLQYSEPCKDTNGSWWVSGTIINPFGYKFPMSEVGFDKCDALLKLNQRLGIAGIEAEDILV